MPVSHHWGLLESKQKVIVEVMWVGVGPCCRLAMCLHSSRHHLLSLCLMRIDDRIDYAEIELLIVHSRMDYETGTSARSAPFDSYSPIRMIGTPSRRGYALQRSMQHCDFTLLADYATARILAAISRLRRGVGIDTEEPHSRNIPSASGSI